MSLLKVLTPRCTLLFRLQSSTAVDRFVLTEECARKIPHLHRIHGAPRPAFGGRHIVTMLVGRGSGQELMQCVQKVFDFIRVPVVFDIVEFGKPDFIQCLPQAILSCKRNRVAIKTSVNLKCKEEIKATTKLRNSLDLYISVMHCRSILGVKTSKHPGNNSNKVF